MEKSAIFVASMIALVAFSAWAPHAEAYETFDGGCQGCHGSFIGGIYTSRVSQDQVSWGTDLHSGHQNMVSGDCDTCHQSFGDTPIIGGPSGDEFDSCVGCHGRNEDLNGGQIGAGLRQHHNVVGASSCGSCHSDNDPATFTTVAEDVPGARNAALGIDPCADAFFGMFGSDNDGNGLYDGEDLMACLAKGDINGSGVADLTDVILSLQIAAGMTPVGTVHKEADINNDQKVGIPEAVWIMSNSGL